MASVAVKIDIKREISVITELIRSMPIRRVGGWVATGIAETSCIIDVSPYVGGKIERSIVEALVGVFDILNVGFGEDRRVVKG